MSDTAPIEHPSWLTSGDFTAADEPLRLFAAWFEEAALAEEAEANAMSVATVDGDGMPNVRMVLLKGFDERGFVFYSNQGSQKGQELAATAKAALAFHWPAMKRQVRVRGHVEIVPDAEADAYFASRARMSQIGAWASNQSQPLESRLAFEKAVALYTARYAIGAVPRPPFWIGYRVVPLLIEFWQDRPFRLHDRIEFRRAEAGAAWIKTRLYP
jgi:pyridoxamine 5'-phosphate oxidase